MVSAGEVEQFAYCAHNWWLARQGVDDPATSLRGIGLHDQVDQALELVDHERHEESFAWRSMTWILSLALAVFFLTFVVLLLGDTPHRFIIATLGLFLTGASASLMVLALLAQRRAARAVDRYGIRPELVAGSGARGSGPTLEDPRWDLRGTPDALLETQEGLVPVEIKTGRTPRQPHRSHVLQLACYLHLLEATRGKRPTYGLLQYPKGIFRVDWSLGLESELKEKLDEIRRARVQGRADRDHEHVARCRGCARRHECDQSLA